MTGERLQILSYARHFWPFSSEGSSACHTYRDTGHPFIVVISDHEDPWHSHLLPSLWQCSSHYPFLRLRSRLGFEHRTFRLWAHVLTHCATAATMSILTPLLYVKSIKRSKCLSLFLTLAISYKGLIVSYKVIISLCFCYQKWCVSLLERCDIKEK